MRVTIISYIVSPAKLSAVSFPDNYSVILELTDDPSPTCDIITETVHLHLVICWSMIEISVDCIPPAFKWLECEITVCIMVLRQTQNNAIYLHNYLSDWTTAVLIMEGLMLRLASKPNGTLLIRRGLFDLYSESYVRH